MPTERTQFARTLRSNSTDAERALWQRIRAQQLGVKFRRQIPFGLYTLDFYCLELRLAIEIDGGQHNESAKDRARDEFMASKGITVLRFWNHEAFQNMEGVLERVLEVVRALPHPSPPLREGRE